MILGPYGLSGTLTGVSYRHSEPSIQKLLDEWRQFFPVETKAPPTESLEPPLPAAVEVIVGELPCVPSLPVAIKDDCLTSSLYDFTTLSSILKGVFNIIHLTSFFMMFCQGI